MEQNVMIWLAAIIVFVIFEAVTYQIVSIWFVLGAAGALITYFLGASFNMQVIVFVIVSAISLVCLRPVSKKLLRYKKENTNVDSLIGKDVLVTKEVDNLQGTGEGKVGGMTWTLRSANDSGIPAGATAVVQKVEGVKLIVK